MILHPPIFIINVDNFLHHGWELKLICRPLKELKPLQSLLLSPPPHTRQKSSSHQCSKNRLRHRSYGAKTMATVQRDLSHPLTGKETNGHIYVLLLQQQQQALRVAKNNIPKNKKYNTGLKLQRNCLERKVIHDVLISQGRTHWELFDLNGSYNTGKNLVVRVKKIVKGVYTV
ncbi:hypothetical protein K435DRAFT_802196 [Dendrothele bispora CBS 962.96]|uniref:Uncharacterized protein n=1 Tax=Dendrothele bispora (strain CBS 962.96) TaxID=1314807 RepID=A0A4S8LLV2_DENBC|nr:hypothetical protein K435DRAFT_802196 [Dendrothele bispora CBS 962.96]